jgi:hypothetical protein
LSESSLREPRPIPGLYSDTEELVEAIRKLPNDVMVKTLSELAVASNAGDSRRVSELSLALVVTVRPQQDVTYRLGVKQVERADEEAPPEPIDRAAHFRQLRAVRAKAATAGSHQR